jgi:tryptophanyl-tRNA synthetase
MKSLTFDLAASYLALGLNPEKTIFFKQSDLSEHAELCWIFDCITKIPFLERAHAWKDAKAKGKKEESVGLFNYPILQAADILLYQPDLVPVGQDQKQHIEMTRDIAQNFNTIFGETFKTPDPHIKEEVAIVPGTDGQKMSKSYGNTIDIFAPEEILKKQVMSIVTNSIPVEDPKDPNSCNVFNIYKLLGTKEETTALEKRYMAGGLGYGDAKKELLQKINETFSEARERHKELIKNDDFIINVLKEGSEKARKVAAKTLEEVKEKVGYC